MVRVVAGAGFEAATANIIRNILFVFYLVFFYYFEQFLREYEDRFEKEYEYFRPVIQDVTEGHHEARRAVVISGCYAKGKGLLRYYVPRNKP
jgi:hypothetical protein